MESKKSRFGLADVVMLRSGGPHMTVAAVNGSQVHVNWFDALDELHTEVFSQDELIPVADPEVFESAPAVDMSEVDEEEEVARCAANSGDDGIRKQAQAHTYGAGFSPFTAEVRVTPGLWMIEPNLQKFLGIADAMIARGSNAQEAGHIAIRYLETELDREKFEAGKRV